MNKRLQLISMVLKPHFDITQKQVFTMSNYNYLTKKLAEQANK